MSGGAAVSDIPRPPAVILCGGLGTRLRPLVSDRPKALAEVAGRPFLAWLLEQLESAGVAVAALATGHMGDQIRSALGEAYGAVRLLYCQEPEPLGTAGALRLAAGLLPGASSLLVMNGDSWCGFDLREFMRHHLRSGVPNSILATPVADVSRFGSITADGDGLIRRFNEKGGTSGPGLINAGVYLVSKELIDSIPSGRPVSIEREIFPAWTNGKLRIWKTDGPFIDIGTPERFSRAARFFAGLAHERA